MTHEELFNNFYQLIEMEIDYAMEDHDTYQDGIPNNLRGSAWPVIIGRLAQMFLIYHIEGKVVYKDDGTDEGYDMEEAKMVVTKLAEKMAEPIARAYIREKLEELSREHSDEIPSR